MGHGLVQSGFLNLAFLAVLMKWSIIDWRNSLQADCLEILELNNYLCLRSHQASTWGYFSFMNNFECCILMINKTFIFM